MASILSVASGRKGKFTVLSIGLIVAMGISSFAGKFEKAQKNDPVSFLPGGTESLKELDATRTLPSGNTAPAVTVIQVDGPLTASQRAYVAGRIKNLNDDRPLKAEKTGPPVISKDRTTALIITPVVVDYGTNEILDSTNEIRDRFDQPPAGLDAKVTGPAGYSADAIKVFEGINGTLLYAAAGIVLILLILIYRSPIFWIIPFFTVILAEGTSRGLGYLLAESGVTINGQAGGILPVLVFGAGTDYALLLVARYREELRNHADKHEAMKIALRQAGPAIVASAATVIAALLTLSLAEVNGTAGLGPVGAMGIAVAMLAMLTILPALLTICGRRAFWPYIPRVGSSGTDETHGLFRRIGDRIAVRPRRVWVGATLLLVVLSLGLTQLNTGLTSGNQFRGSVDSVQGQEMIARAFPAGSDAPSSIIVTDPAEAPEVIAAVSAVPGVASVELVERGDVGVRLEVVLSGDPYSTSSFDQVPGLREIAHNASGSDVLVGGPTAQEYDLRKAAVHDNRLIMPIALLVIFLILILLLRALVVPMVLIASVVLSFAAALGIGTFFFENVFDFPGVDPSFPLFVFIFLVSLGVDYNIFLMARVREETVSRGPRDGMLRGLAVTGAVITSAGIVLAGTFSALAVLPLVFLTELGFTVAVGVLLDTIIVRSILVPAVVLDLDKRAWWPSRLSR